MMWDGSKRKWDEDEATPTNADAACFIRGRLKFYNADGIGAIPRWGSVVMYYGPNVPVFVENFKQFGVVMHHV